MKKSRFVSWLPLILVLLQLLNPFLHAHAEGLAGVTGLHIHAQNDEWTPEHFNHHLDQNTALSTDESSHRVFVMPVASFDSEALQQPDTDASQPAGMVASFPITLPSPAALQRIVITPQTDPLPGADSDHLPPPALAPPLA